MESDLEQFADLELSKEDHEQLFDPPSERYPSSNPSRYLNY